MPPVPFSELTAFFNDLGLAAPRPGFYDAPEFIAQEQQDPRMLELYAAYVEARPYDATYLANATALVHRLASFMAERLQRDGRLGACADASGVALRILEREGVWAYMVDG